MGPRGEFRREVIISENTTYSVFVLRMLTEKARRTALDLCVIVTTFLYNEKAQGVKRGTYVLHEEARSGRELNPVLFIQHQITENCRYFIL